MCIYSPPEERLSDSVVDLLREKNEIAHVHKKQIQLKKFNDQIYFTQLVMSQEASHLASRIEWSFKVKKMTGF